MQETMLRPRYADANKQWGQEYPPSNRSPVRAEGIVHSDARDKIHRFP